MTRRASPSPYATGLGRAADHDRAVDLDGLAAGEDQPRDCAGRRRGRLLVARQVRRCETAGRVSAESSASITGPPGGGGGTGIGTGGADGVGTGIGSGPARGVDSGSGSVGGGARAGSGGRIRRSGRSGTGLRGGLRDRDGRRRDRDRLGLRLGGGRRCGLLDAGDPHQPRRHDVRRAVGVAGRLTDPHPQPGHPGDVAFDPGGVGGSGDRDRSVGGAQHGLALAPDHHLHVAGLVADQHEARQLAEPAADQRVEHLVEAGAVVDKLPDPGDPGLRARRQEHEDGVAQHAVPVPRHDSTRHGHGRAPSFWCRLSRWCRES